MLKPNSKIHIIGIAGAGVSALAVMLKNMGHSVTGSDEGFYEPVIGYLKKHDVEILTPYKKENIPDNVDIIIIGKHSKLNPEENEEVAVALTMSEKIRSFPQVLGEATLDRENIIVAGSYGKSTCASLMAWCLIQAGKDTGYFFGAIPIGFAESGHYGTEKSFVMEGDEYPAYNGPSKFLYLHPKHILLTSAEHDHVNVFPTEESYIAPYKELVKLLPENGTLVVGINNPNVKDIASGFAGKVVTYGLDKATWHPRNIEYGVQTYFDLYKGETKIVELTTTLLGTHNIENIVGVAAFLLEQEMVSVANLQKAISVFRGLRRRLDLKTTLSSVLVYEGFGSSYMKAKTVFGALKLHFPTKRIVTIFEPHTFSWRNKNNLEWYKDIFDQSDETIVFAPPNHGKNTHDQATLEDILAEVRKSKSDTYGVENKEEAMKILENIVKPDDVIVLMSSGELGGLIEAVPTWAEHKFPG